MCFRQLLDSQLLRAKWKKQKKELETRTTMLNDIEEAAKATHQRLLGKAAVSAVRPDTASGIRSLAIPATTAAGGHHICEHCISIAATMRSAGKRLGLAGKRIKRSEARMC